MWSPTRRAAERRRRQYDAGESVRIPTRARGARPFPRWWAWGNVWTGEDPLVFRRWHRLIRGAPLTALTLLRKAIDTDAPQPAVAFQFRDAEGRRVELSVGEDDADLFDTVLRDPVRPGTGAVRRATPVWQLAVAGGALLWLLGWAYLAAAGTVLSATVLANDEQSCRVEWTLAGRTGDATVDCYDEQPGEAVEVLALPAPFRGEATDTDITPVMVVGLGVLGILPLAATGISRLVRRRRPPAVAPPAPGAVAVVDVPRLEPGELRFSRIAEVLERRAGAEGWAESAGPPWWVRRMPTPGTRLAVRRLWWVGLVLLIWVLPAGLFGWTSARTALLLDPARAREAAGVVTNVESYLPLVPYDVEVEFDVNGRTRHVVVASTSEPAEGDRVTIRYDAARPDVARRVVDDGVARGLLVAAALLGAGLAFVLWRGLALAVELRRLRRRRAEPPNAMRYALVLNQFGDVLMLLAGLGDYDPRPELLVQLDSLPPGVPIAGTADVHGPVESGEVVVVRVGERLLYPDGPVLGIDEEELGFAVSGELPPDDE